MLIWFFQRYAMYFAVLAGIFTARWSLPDDASLWVGIVVAGAVSGAIYLLLYKDGVTANRRKREPNNPFR